jgi:hypothetical protein
MQHIEESNLGAEVLGIGGYSAPGFGSGTEQNAVDHFFVLVGDRGNLFRQRKDHMEILSIEKFRAVVLKPFRASQ